MNNISYIAGTTRDAGAFSVREIQQHDTTDMLEKALPILEVSNRILANNVANANTPGFTPNHISFRESLEQAVAGKPVGLPLKVTHPRHIIPNGEATSELILEREAYGPGRNDESKFDIDREMVELLKNSGRFDILSGILTKRYRQMREVLRSA